MILADETAPLSRASKLAASAECAKPRSSACRMSSLEPAGYPSRSATVLAWAGSVDARKTNIADHRASRMEAPIIVKGSTTNHATLAAARAYGKRGIGLRRQS